MSGDEAMADFYSVQRIVFGRGEVKRVPELARQFGKRVLVVANGPEGNVSRLEEKLGAAGMSVISRRQKGEPTVSDVDGATDFAREHGSEVVIGFGGGSAIDAAKAVAMLLTNRGSALDYLEVVGLGKKIEKPAAPWIAVPCTAGTGAEATRNAVVSLPEKKFKASLRSEGMLPRAAVIDAELGVGVPGDVTARSGMDALCQCIEAYTSNGASALTDPLALEGITRAGRSLARAVEDGGDIEAREDMALAALLSGMALTNAGLGAVHGFAAAMGAAFPAPHGTICAALLAPVMVANIAALGASDPAHPVLLRYARIGRVLADAQIDNERAAMKMGAVFVRGLCERLAIPSLAEFGVTERDVPEIVAAAQKSSSMRYNPVVLSAETLGVVLREAL